GPGPGRYSRGAMGHRPTPEALDRALALASTGVSVGGYDAGSLADRVRPGRREGPVTPEEFLDGLPEPRRSEMVQLDVVIRAAVPELARTVQGGMLGYGPYRYRYPSGREGDTCVVSLASQKGYISL